MNTFGASIGLTRYFGGTSRATLADGSSGLVRRPTFKPYVSYDLIVYGATRKKGVFPAEGNPVLVPGIWYSRIEFYADVQLQPLLQSRCVGRCTVR